MLENISSNLGKGNSKDRKPTGVDSLGASKGPVPISTDKMDPTAKAKWEFWDDAVMSKWNIFHDAGTEKTPKEYEIERENKSNIIESVLEQLSSLNIDSNQQTEISNFDKKLKKIGSSNVNIDLKELKELMEKIHKFFNSIKF